MTEPKTMHAWLPTGRSLCDRRALPPEADSPEEALAMEAVSSAAPVCGACVFLVHALRSNLALLEAEERGFWPETAADSAAALQGTGWPEFINAESLEDFGDLAGLSRSGFGSEELNVAVAKRTQATREAIRDLQQQIAQKSPGAS